MWELCMSSMVCILCALVAWNYKTHMLSLTSVIQPTSEMIIIDLFLLLPIILSLTRMNTTEAMVSLVPEIWVQLLWAKTIVHLQSSHVDAIIWFLFLWWMVVSVVFWSVVIFNVNQVLLVYAGSQWVRFGIYFVGGPMEMYVKRQYS
jgi:hypothetical protein